MESIDSNGLLPIYATEQVASRAFDFRRYLQKELPKHLREFPRANPLAQSKLALGAKIPANVLKRWPAASERMLAGEQDSLSALCPSITPWALLRSREVTPARASK